MNYYNNIFSAGGIEPVEEVMVAANVSMTSAAPSGGKPVNEPHQKKESAKTTGGKGNPYYAAELDKGK